MRQNVIIPMVLAACMMAGCGSSRTSVKTEAKTEANIEETRERVSEKKDSTGIDMSRQLSVRDRLAKVVDFDLEEEIETTNTAATDSTPATTTTRIKRHFKAKAKTDAAREVTDTTEVHAEETAQETATENSRTTKAIEETYSQEQLIKKHGRGPVWFAYAFVIALAVIFLTQIWMDFKGKK